MNDQLCTTITKPEFRSIVENYMTRLDDFWIGVLNREIECERARLSRKRLFIFPAKISNATDDDAKVLLLKRWNSCYSHWSKQYNDAREEAEILLRFINDSSENEINVPFSKYHILTKEKISD